MQYLSSRRVKASVDMHTTVEELWEVVFSMQSVLRLYNEEQLPLTVSHSVRVDS
jgi:hypothetical protein